MKAYTDLEQSEKLAEILPLESADMYWAMETISYLCLPLIDGTTDWDYAQENNLIPAWSLAALIDIIPQEIFDGEYIINITEGRDNKWILTYDYFEDRTRSYYGLSTGADNLVDACYKLILKLHERKML